MSVFEAMQGSGIATFVRESPSMLGYTAFLSLHAMGLAIVVGLSAAVSLRLLGVARDLPLAPMRKLFPWMYFGFVINALSGLGLFAAAAISLSSSAIFLIKMIFVVLGVIVIGLIHRFVFAGPALAEADGIPGGARWLAGVSLALWVGALITGRLTGYPYLVRAYLGI